MTARLRRLLLPLALFALGGAPGAALSASAPGLSYSIDLNRRADDLFHVTLTVSGLGAENAVYQFAATAPGTYQVMNIGRYVKSVRGARREAAGRVPAEQISVNQWRLCAIRRGSAPSATP